MDHTTYENLAKAWDYVEEHATDRQSNELKELRIAAQEAGMPAKRRHAGRFACGAGSFDECQIGYRRGHRFAGGNVGIGCAVWMVKAS